MSKRSFLRGVRRFLGLTTCRAMSRQATIRRRFLRLEGLESRAMLAIDLTASGPYETSEGQPLVAQASFTDHNASATKITVTYSLDSTFGNADDNVFSEPSLIGRICDREFQHLDARRGPGGRPGH